MNDKDDKDFTKQLIVAIAGSLIGGALSGLIVVAFQPTILEKVGFVKPEDKKEVINCRRDLNNKGFPDLEPLCEPLKNKFGRNADDETYKAIGKIIAKSGKSNGKRYNVSSIKKYVGCPVLKEIDELWKQSSNKKLGFSAQKKIWEESEKDYVTFATKVQWRDQRSGWYSRLDYELENSPPGHLPALWNSKPGDDLDDSKKEYNEFFEYINTCEENNWTIEASNSQL